MSQLPLFQPVALTVSDLTRYLRELLESDAVLQDVWVQGEVSNLSRPSSGHLYFTLKDSGAALRCVMWRSSAARQAYLPADGEAVEVHGAISIYEVGGQYQLYADLIRPAGEGALYQEFLRLKARLEAEGLFDPERKRPIPQWPQRIGIVTSPTGAALRDMLHTLQRRFPLVEVILAPTAVQGEEAPPGIVAALAALNRVANPDVILVARGGGSIEDLWAFNDERVARAIAASQAPVITGVGHETDFTIADFVADLRAPTPTAAAELAVPSQADLRVDLEDWRAQLTRAMTSQISEARWAYNEITNHLKLNSPRTRLRSDQQRVDELANRSLSAISHRLQLEKAHLAGFAQHLGSLDPRSILGRGFAMITNAEGALIHSITQTEINAQIHIHLQDGSLEARVLGRQGYNAHPKTEEAR